MGKNEKIEFRKPELLNDILQETDELIKTFVASIKTAEKKKIWSFRVRHWFFYSMLDVRCSMLDVHLTKQLRAA